MMTTPRTHMTYERDARHGDDDVNGSNDNGGREVQSQEWITNKPGTTWDSP